MCLLFLLAATKWSHALTRSWFSTPGGSAFTGTLTQQVQVYSCLNGVHFERANTQTHVYDALESPWGVMRVFWYSIGNLKDYKYLLSAHPGQSITDSQGNISETDPKQNQNSWTTAKKLVENRYFGECWPIQRLFFNQPLAPCKKFLNTHTRKHRHTHTHTHTYLNYSFALETSLCNPQASKK